jgi:hypothetical protein
MNTQTITAPIENGEVVVFKLGFTCSFDEFIENVSLIESVDCVNNGVDLGMWVIL